MRPGRASKSRRRERRRGRLQALRQLGLDDTGGTSLGDAKRGRGQLGGRDAGDPVDQFVRLVDDQQVVFGQHVGIADGVDGQQGVVGDDDIGLPRAFTGASRRSNRCRTGSATPRCIPGTTR